MRTDKRSYFEPGKTIELAEQKDPTRVPNWRRRELAEALVTLSKQPIATKGKSLRRK